MSQTIDTQTNIVTPEELEIALEFGIKNNYSMLITGEPGIGKSDIIKQAALKANADLIITHPVVSDPTDFKGLPFPDKSGTHANFLTFGNLKELEDAKKLTVFFIDDLGQAPISVQAAIMQLVLNREINGKKISDHVVFIAATNRKQDQAGVTGLLRPLKGRNTILQLKVCAQDWVNWALQQNDLPVELIAFIQFNPDILEKAEPSNDLVNTANPRTITRAGRAYNNNLPAQIALPFLSGSAGEEFAREFLEFVALFQQIPNIDSIILNPDKAPIPKEPGILYGLITALAKRMDDVNINSIVKYLDRLNRPEFSTACFHHAHLRNPDIAKNKAFIQWVQKNNAKNKN